MGDGDGEVSLCDTLRKCHRAAAPAPPGGAPCLADFGLIGPLYGHIYNDAVSGFELRTRFPFTAEWVTRCIHQ